MQGRLAVSPPKSAPAMCVICGQPLRLHAALTPRTPASGPPVESHPLCLDVRCRMLFEQARHLPAADFRRHLRRCAQAKEEQRRLARLLQEKLAAEARHAAAAFEALTSRTDRGDPADLRLVVASGHAPLRVLQRRRRAAHEAHLDAIIAAAFDAPPPPSSPAAAAAAGGDDEAAHPDIAGRLCGVCGGGCCVRGGDVAYLSAATIQRVMGANPDLDPIRLRAIYLSRLAKRTVSGSCIHHTRAGCSLPRSLRSDICNTYACASLRQVQDAAATAPLRKVAVLRRRQNQWSQEHPSLDNAIVGAAVLTASRTTTLRWPRTRTGDTDGSPP